MFTSIYLQIEDRFSNRYINNIWFKRNFSTQIFAIIFSVYFIIIIICSLEFFTSVLADGLSLEFEWQQVSRSLLSILAVLNNAVVWMVSTRPPTFKSSILFNNPLVTVPKTPITIGIIVTFTFHNFKNSLAKLRHLSFFSYSFYGQPGQQSRQFCKFSFFIDYYMAWSSGRD